MRAPGKPGAPIVFSVDDANDLKSPFCPSSNAISLPVQCAKLKAYLNDKYQDQSLAEVGRQVKERMISLAPCAVFAFVPVFALITMLLYRRRACFTASTWFMRFTCMLRVFVVACHRSGQTDRELAFHRRRHLYF